jgi:uncharacterized protein (DUF697 family)
MKYEILKMCLMLIAFLTVSFGLAYQFKSAIVPIEWLASAGRQVQAFFSAQPLKTLTFPDITQYWVHMAGLAAKPGFLKTILTSLGTVLLLALALAGRAWHQKRVRIRDTRKLEILQQKIQQLGCPEATDIEPAIANLTALQLQLAEQSAVTSTQLPMFYALRGEVDSALNCLKDKRQLLLNEAVLKKTEQPEKIESLGQAQNQLLQPHDTALVEVFISVAARPARVMTARSAKSHFTRVLAWKRGYQPPAIPESQPQPQAMLADAEPSVAAETLTAPALAATPNFLVQSICKIKGFDFWQHTSQDNISGQAGMPLTEQAQVTPVVQTSADDPVRATATLTTATLMRSLSKFFSFGAGEKSPVPDDEALRVQEQLLTLSTQGDSGTTTASDGQIPVATDARHQRALGIVRKHMLAGMALSTVPMPFLDVACLTGTQLNLLNNLSAHYGVAYTKERGKPALVAMLSGSLPTTLLMWLSSLSKAIPGIGTVSGGISLSATAGAVIYATGQVFIRHLEDGGGLDNFDGKQQRAHFQQALKDGLADHAK